MSDQLICARMNEALISRIEKARETLSAHAMGANISRSDAIRVALEKGLEQIESQSKSGQRRKR